MCPCTVWVGSPQAWHSAASYALSDDAKRSSALTHEAAEAATFPLHLNHRRAITNRLCIMSALSHSRVRVHWLIFYLFYLLRFSSFTQSCKPCPSRMSSVPGRQRGRLQSVPAGLPLPLQTLHTHPWHNQSPLTPSNTPHPARLWTTALTQTD